MFVIRDEQIEAINRAARQRFVRDLAREIRDRFPNLYAEWPETELEQFVAQSMADSEGYSVTDETDIRTFVEYAALYGPDFHRSFSWAAEILSNSRLSGTRKMKQIDDYDLFVARNSA